MMLSAPLRLKCQVTLQLGMRQQTLLAPRHSARHCVLTLELRAGNNRMRDHIPDNLTAKLLIAMPDMGDPRFSGSVVFLCAHSAENTMGLILNKRNRELRLPHLLEQLKIKPTDEARDLAIYIGGPVETGRGFVLHSADYVSKVSTLQVDDRFGMTATLDVLEEFSRGQGPDRARLMLGYAGWGPGQLEREIAHNGWLVCDASPELVFDTPDGEKWSAALETLGVSALHLSATGGRA